MRRRPRGRGKLQRPANAAGRQAQGLGAARRTSRSRSRSIAGLDDDTFTEIVSGDVKPGDQVIVAEQRERRARRPSPRRDSDAGRQGRRDHGGTDHQARARHADLPRRRRRRACAARRQPHDRGRRVRRHHGLVGLRQVDADGDARLPRPAEQRPLFLRRRRRGAARASPTSRACAASASASCSRASICWRAPARIENVALPLFYAASGPASAGLARRAGARGAQAARARRPRAQHARPALGRPAAAGGDRARPDQQPEPAARRRADRQSRHAARRTRSWRR